MVIDIYVEYFPTGYSPNKKFLKYLPPILSMRVSLRNRDVAILEKSESLKLLSFEFTCECRAERARVHGRIAHCAYSKRINMRRYSARDSRSRSSYSYRRYDVG